jgi:hypothetical protein
MQIQGIEYKVAVLGFVIVNKVYFFENRVSKQSHEGHQVS